MVSEKASQTLPIGKGYKLRSKEREYEIVAVLGSGAFGITYLAKAKVSVGNISTTMSFAIKEHFISASCYRGEDGATVLTVPTAKSDVVDSRADFITEANRLKKLCLKSRNIVSVNETFEANGTAYYVMEYLDGGSPSRCPEKDAVSIVMQVAEALDEIHKERVLHLDLKPDNIVLKTNERKETYPVLIDFGISKHFDSKGRPTSSLSAKGASPGYAPQEQYAGVNEFSPKYDIYALGAVLFYLCTGKNPPDAFKISPNQQELRRELTGKVSANVEKAILNAMRPSAMERTPDIQRFRDDLMGIDFIPVLNPSTSIVEFNYDKGQHTVSVDSNIGWTVYSDVDWCKVTKKNNNIVISVSSNKETCSRACQVSVNGAPYQVSQIIRIKQEGTGTEVLPKEPTWWKRNSRKVYVALGVVIAGGLIVGLSQLLKPDHDNESKLLTQAITSMNGEKLKVFAEKDSSRAFLPYAQYLITQQQGDLAEHYAKRALLTTDSINARAFMDTCVYFGKPVYSNVLEPENDENEITVETEIIQSNEPSKESSPESKEESNDEKFARASNDFNLMLSLAKDNYAKAYYPLAEMYFQRKSLDNAKIWATKAVNANVNRKQAQNLLSRIAPPSPSNDELFAKATTLEDFKALANKGYKKAYAPLAEQYLKKHQYDNAHQWAVKAGNANEGVETAQKVVEILESYGYYDNGEHGGKPTFKKRRSIG